MRLKRELHTLLTTFVIRENCKSTKTLKNRLHLIPIGTNTLEMQVNKNSFKSRTVLLKKHKGSEANGLGGLIWIEDDSQLTRGRKKEQQTNYE